MDLPTRDRADQDVAALPDREPDLSQARDRRSSSQRFGALAPSALAAAPASALGLAGCAIACAIALVLALNADVVGAAAVPGVLRTAVAAVALFLVCGYAPARALTGGELRDYRPLLALPIGATISSL